MTTHHSDARESVLEISLEVVVPHADLVVFTACQAKVLGGEHINGQNNICVSRVQLDFIRGEFKKFQRLRVAGNKGKFVFRLYKFHVDYLIQVKTETGRFMQRDFLA